MKKVLKEEKLKQEEKYMWAVVDGVKEKVIPSRRFYFYYICCKCIAISASLMYRSVDFFLIICFNLN